MIKQRENAFTFAYGNALPEVNSRLVAVCFNLKPHTSTSASLACRIHYLNLQRALVFAMSSFALRERRLLFGGRSRLTDRAPSAAPFFNLPQVRLSNLERRSHLTVCNLKTNTSSDYEKTVCRRRKQRSVYQQFQLVFVLVDLSGVSFLVFVPFFLYNLKLFH